MLSVTDGVDFEDVVSGFALALKVVSVFFAEKVDVISDFFATSVLVE